MDPARDKEAALRTLSRGEISLQGQFVRGSNYSFLVDVALEESIPAVYKPTRGEQPLWDFPTHSLAKREAAAYLVSEALGWGFVPPTVYRRKGPLGPGSLQLFIPHQPEYHTFNFTPEDQERLRPVAVFDLLTNNADRKASHVLKDGEDRLWLIDHGLCFHLEEKLRTVIWEFAGQPIPSDLLPDLARLAEQLTPEQPLWLELKKLLRQSEIRALRRRALLLTQNPVFPYPPANERPFPWPPV